MDDIIGDLSDFIFSLFISYVGAMELLLVLRHLCHNAGQHPVQQPHSAVAAGAEELKEYQDQLRRQLAKATEIEAQSGANAMQDGVLYQEGFRLDPQQAEIERLKTEMEAKEAKEKRRAELEAELARQRQIEEETRQQLEHAEAELARQRAAAAAAKEQEEALAAAEEAENLRKMLEAERQREAEQRRKEQEEEEAAASERELLAAETQREANQRQFEEDEAKGDQNAAGASQRFLEAEKLHDLETSESDESEIRLSTRLPRAGSSEDRQRLIEENARKFLEAELEMVALQQRMSEQPPEAVVEEQFMQRSHASSKSARPRTDALTTTVKTQFGQGNSESFVVSTKPLLFPGVSDDASSNEPFSSKQSSLSTHPSEEITTTGTEDASRSTIGLQIPQHERQEPDGEDNAPPMQYSEDYLRSLDGIKARSLIREDGSGRRRAFKKRRSSGSSNSSRDSRASREEELKMFTSLEEEELQNTQKGDGNFTPIKYTNDPALKVKSHHHRRHKRSPAKDGKADEPVRTSLEMLGEEGTNPWGEVVPEHYKDMDFWKREKAMSIDEEEIEVDSPKTPVETTSESATNKPNSSSFEEASHEQNEEALSTLQKQLAKDPETEGSPEASAEIPDTSQTTSENRSNLTTSPEAESNASPARSSSSPRLRRSPRIDEMDQYEDRWIESEIAARNQVQPTSPTTPSISVYSTEDSGSWRDEHGLIMQGLSDFYDFTASTNPSRSRPTSRNASPINTVPNTPLLGTFPSFVQHGESTIGTEATAANQNVDANPGNFVDCKIAQDILPDFIEPSCDAQISQSPAMSTPQSSITEERSSIPIIQIENDDRGESIYENGDREEMESLVQTLRAQRAASRSRSRSRSRSPLPTTENIARSLETRRAKLIKHNDELFERLTEDSKSPEESSETVPRKELIEEKAVDMRSSEGSSHEEMIALVQTLRVERAASRSRSRSRSPLPTPENLKHSLDNRRSKLIKHNDEVFEQLAAEATLSSEPRPEPFFHDRCVEDNAREEMVSLVQTLRAERAASQTRSRSRSRSPLPTAENLTRGIENRRSKLIQHNDEILERLSGAASSHEEHSQPMDSWTHIESPTITVESIDSVVASEQPDPEDVSSLVASLRVARARSRSMSKSPMRIPSAQNLEDSINKRREKLIQRNDQLSAELYDRSKSPQPPRVLVQYVYEYEESAEDDDDDGDDESFHRMLNLESSVNRTLSKNSEESESILAEKQRSVDEEALFKLKTASEEMELRTVTPTDLWPNSQLEAANPDALKSEAEGNDLLSELPLKKRLQKLRCTPTTPEYNRNISEERRDVLRIKNEMLASGFKRSTYVGESLDLGSEYEELRREAAEFRRSRTPSPSFEEPHVEATTRQTAAERRRMQDSILSELMRSSGDAASSEDTKIEQNSIDESRRRSTYGEESLVEEMRRDMADFRRSRSCSRSPVDERTAAELAPIDAEVAKRAMQDEMLDKLSGSGVSFQDFSRHLKADFLDDRRASDSAVIQKPEFLMQYRDSHHDYELEPEEYHHYRRFSLNQEPPTEEYPSDEFVCVSQVEVHTLTGSRTWTREDYYSADFDELPVDNAPEGGAVQAEHDQVDPEIVRDEEESDGSEDERQTVVEVDDEIDTDICDFNERGPTDESHHEQSECEEAERSVDHYANLVATDWQDVEDVNDILSHNEDNNYNNNDDDGGGGNSDEGATGGADTDSYAIDQIYGEAIKNRKQSGILREYDSILLEMQKSFERNPELEDDCVDSDRYALWAKTRGSAGEKKHSVSFIESEIRDTEVRYLSDAKTTARQSTRLRSRYGFVPQLQSDSAEHIDVDLDYKPKREYNWRKNFKLDDDDDYNNNNRNNERETNVDGGHRSIETDDYDDDDVFDERKYSLGGESITLFSRSPEREIIDLTALDAEMQVQEMDMSAEAAKCGKEPDTTAKEKPNPKKKKKSKKKALRESKEILERRLSKDDEEDSDSQTYSRRRSSSIQMETDSPKRKSRSRRSSRSSINKDDPSAALFSPRSSAGLLEYNKDFTQNGGELEKEPLKKKIKKRKKAKDSIAVSQDIKEEQEQMSASNAAEAELELELEQEKMTNDRATVSTNISPESASLNMLSVLSPQNSICVTPQSTESETTTAAAATAATSAAKANAVNARAATTTPLETFDILKDANFYPLF